MIDIWFLGAFILLIFLLALSAFFSAAEMAFMTVSRIRIRESAKKGDKHAVIVEKLLREPHKLITGILIGNNLVNICASIIVGAIALRIFGNLGIAIATLVMTFIILLFCEITPKAFAMRNERLALRFAAPLQYFIRVFSPITSGFTAMAYSIVKAFGKKLPSQKVTLTETELRTLLEMAEEQGTIKRAEREMIHEVFELDEIPVSRIMTPKEKMVSAEEAQTIESFLELVSTTGRSRIPVYKGSKENIVGVAHVKDALKSKNRNMPVKDIMHTVFTLNMNERADEALRKMQKEKRQIAIVADENNNLKGLISLEDLIEEIVGEIE